MPHLFKSLSGVATVLVLSACGGSVGVSEPSQNIANHVVNSAVPMVIVGPSGPQSNTSSVPHTSVPFEDLTGAKGRTTGVQPIYGVSPLRERFPLSGRSAGLYGVLQSIDDITPFRAGLDIIEKYNGVSLAPLHEPGYFAQKSIVVVDIARGEMDTLTLTELSEYSDHIEVAFELCSNDQMSQGGMVTGEIFISMAKTAKPVVVLPMRFSGSPPWKPNMPGLIGRCI